MVGFASLIAVEIGMAVTESGASVAAVGVETVAVTVDLAFASEWMMVVQLVAAALHLLLAVTKCALIADVTASLKHWIELQPVAAAVIQHHFVIPTAVDSNLSNCFAGPVTAVVAACLTGYSAGSATSVVAAAVVDFVANLRHCFAGQLVEFVVELQLCFAAAPLMFESVVVEGLMFVVDEDQHSVDVEIVGTVVVASGQTVDVAVVKLRLTVEEEAVGSVGSQCVKLPAS